MLAAPCLPARTAAAPTPVVSRGSRVVRCTAKPLQVRKAHRAALGVTVSTGSVLAGAGGANAADLSKPLQQFVDTVDAGASLVLEASKSTGALIDGTRQLVDQASPYVDRAGKAIVPVAETVGKVAARTLDPLKDEALKVGTGAADSALKSLSSFASSQGVDVSPIKSAVGTVVKEAPGAAKAAEPFLKSIFDFIIHSDPATLAESGVVLYVLYLILPFGLAAVSTSFRGYAGDISPPQALNLLMKEKGTTLVDIRTTEEQNAKGIVDLPKGNKKQLVSIQRSTLERGPFKNNSSTENKITAVQIAALKATSNKGKNILVLDQNNKQAKQIAKELTSLGYKNAYVVDGGFLNWMAASLQTRSAFSTKADSVVLKAGPSAPRLPTLSSRVVDVEVLPYFGAKVLPPGK